MKRFLTCALITLALLSTSPLFAQQKTKAPAVAPPVLLTRTATRREVGRFAYGGTVTLIGAPRGAVTVEGWSRSEVEVVAEIELKAETEADLDRLAAVNNFSFDEDTNHISILTIGTHDRAYMLAIDQRGNNVTISSTRAQQIQFVANGGEQVETANGRTVRVRSTLTRDTLRIERSGERANDFSVTFESVDNGRQLLVTRQLYSDRFTQPVVVRSYYDKSSDVAQLNLYETNPESRTGSVTATGDFVVPNGTELIGVLNQDLSTRNVQENDRFTMTVRSPGQFDGATIEGYVTGVDRAGRITGRSQATLNFDTIRLRNGQTYRFAGILANVRTPNGDVVRVDTEGAVRDDDNQTNRTVTRTAIGTAVGALIGAIAGGGKGAAIGAVIGAGAGAGSVYVQGRTDLELPAGTEITVQATGPRS